MNLLDLVGLVPYISGVPGLEYPESYRSLVLEGLEIDSGLWDAMFERGAVSARRRGGTSFTVRT